MTQEDSQTIIASIRTCLTGLSSSDLTEDQKTRLDESLKELENLSEAVRNSNNALQEARQARAKFVSVVTHELRIPMTSIKGYTDLLRSGVVGTVNEQQTGFLNVIRNNVERMSSLVSDLSDINHIETGRLRLDLKSVPISTCIEDAILTLKQRLDDKQQRLVCTVPADLTDAFADKNRVVQILSYLVGNANKYTPTEGQISISAFQQGEYIHLEIKDTGIGISPADQEQLFKAFFRSEDAAVRDQPGWGLALNLAKQLVELMRGQIGVQSTIKEGSTFWFTLPISKSGS
jgi:signal transduction histidine kinase